MKKSSVIITLVAFCFFILLLIIFIKYGGLGNKAKIKKTITEYYYASWGNNPAKNYSYIASEDKAVKNLEQYEEENKFNPVAGFLKNKTNLKITRIDIKNKNQATVSIDITGPDIMAIFGDFMAEILRSAGDTQKTEEQKNKELANVIEQKMKGKKIPITTATNTLELIKEPDGWKIIEGWTRAKKLLEDYQENLSLEIFVQRKPLNIYDTTGSPYIVGRITNNGDKTLKSVTITVYFLGTDGNPISEQDYCPTFENYQYELLKPGYIRPFEYFIFEKNVPYDKWTGQVKTEIKEITFQD